MLARLAAMGWRNLSRNRRRTWITAAALGGGLALAAVSWVFTEGYLADTVEAMVGSTTGHVQVQPPGQVGQPNLYDTLPDADALVARLAADPRVRGVAPRIESAALLAAGERSIGVTVLGVDPVREAAVSGLPRRVAEGRLPRGPGEAALGALLARRLHVRVGDEVVAVGQAADGSLANALWTVSGTLDTGVEAVDRSTAWVHVEEARSFYALEGAHRLVIRLEQDGDVDPFVADWAQRPGWTGVVFDLVRLGLRAPDDDHADDPTASDRWTGPHARPADPEAARVVRSWRALNPVMAQTVDVSQSWLFLAVGIVLATAGMGAMNTMLMSVMERARELGILLAVGLRPVHVVLMVLFESVALGVLGLVVGLPLGVAASAWAVRHGVDLSGEGAELVFAGVSMDPVIHGRWSVEAFVVPAAMLLAVTALASLWPAVRAARLDPVEAIGQRE